MSFPMFASLRDFANDYEMPLTEVFFRIDSRGVMVDPAKLGELDKYISDEIRSAEKELSQLARKPCYANKEAAVAAGHKDPSGYVNLAASRQVQALLEAQGLRIPKNRKTGMPTSNEEALQKMISASPHKAPVYILKVREYSKIKGTYVNAELLDNILYSTYVVAGTVGGRRSSRKSYLNIGTNHQNLPKHSKLGKIYRKCIVARPQHIFVACDQATAEDWIVHGIIWDVTNGKITSGIDELRTGVDRHTKLACFIFGKPEEECGKDTAFRFLGKKTRHAGNYGQRGNTMSASLAAEGIHIAPRQCDYFIEMFHKAEPQIEKVFQRSVEETLIKTRTLVTPIGRKRVFFGLRPRSDNADVFRDAYSYIPQSTVGDNTGLAILYLESAKPGIAVADGHDSVVCEIKDDFGSVKETVKALDEAFDREIEFPNGFKLRIPVEFEIGYNLGEMKTVKDLSLLEGTYNSCGNCQAAGLKTT